MTRRTLLRTTSASLPALALPAAAADYRPRTFQTALPRWRGFNLLDLFQAMSRDGRGTPPVTEQECEWMRDWGFNFIRIPIDYWFFVDAPWRETRTLTPDQTFLYRDSAFEPLDRIVELGRKYGLHVNINLHRAPGYCINNNEREPFSLWTNRQAEDSFTALWIHLARRYRSVNPLDLSFNLVNEAPSPREGFMSKDDYYRVMTRGAGAIKEITPNRFILIDGYGAGGAVADNLIPSGLAQSVHCYWPAGISHFRASWVDRNMNFPEPAWPKFREDGSLETGRAILDGRMWPWADLARQGIGVHCGEYGCYNRTPHPIALAWMRDVLEILEVLGIGWSMWNFSGPFGILDSGRTDIDYEEFNGHKLDRKMLELVRKL